MIDIISQKQAQDFGMIKVLIIATDKGKNEKAKGWFTIKTSCIVGTRITERVIERKGGNRIVNYFVENYKRDLKDVLRVTTRNGGAA